MSNDIIMPCPFCGYTSAELTSDIIGEMEFVSVACDNCGGRGGRFIHEEAAIEAWNKRWPTTSPEITAMLKDMVQDFVNKWEKARKKNTGPSSEETLMGHFKPDAE